MYQDPNVYKDTVSNKTFQANHYEVFDTIQDNREPFDNNQQIYYQQGCVDQVPDKFSAHRTDDRMNVNDQEHQISFEEIDAIINSKDFGDIVHQKANIEQIFSCNNNNNAPYLFDEQASLVEGDNNLTANQENLINYRQKASIGSDRLCHPNQPHKTDRARPSSKQLFDDTCLLDSNKMADRNLSNPFQYQQDDYTSNSTTPDRPFVEIVEQPAKCSLRFRYKCEGRSAGSLPGINSNGDNKTYPAIRIANYVGRAVVVVSCVTKDAPYLAHPHNIVGKEGCKKGICTIVISNNEPNTVRTFSSLGIQCVKRKDIEESLNLRESINVDPFRNGFAHKLSASSIDLNVVRLSFQVFIEGSTPKKCDVPLMPVVSDPIHDKKAMSDLVITKLSHFSAPATGGREIILLCDRISKDDIQVRFYEERNGVLVWETYTELSPTDVHRQVAICFRTPKYYNENIAQPVMVCIQLKRLSDNQVSEPRSFQFLPCESDEDIISRKRKKMNQYALDDIFQSFQHQPSANHNQANASQYQQLQQLQPQLQHQQPTLNMGRLESPDHKLPELSPGTSQRPPSQQRQQQGDNYSIRIVDKSASNSPQPLSRNHQQRHQQEMLGSGFIDSQNLVVRREIIDNEGKVMRLVDRPTEFQDDDAQQRSEPIGNPGGPSEYSLDRIDTAGLIQLNSRIDLNLGSGLSINLERDPRENQ